MISRFSSASICTTLLLLIGPVALASSPADDPAFGGEELHYDTSRSNKANAHGWTRLHTAAAKRERLTDSLFERFHISIDATTERFHFTPLHVAALNGNEQAAAFFLAHQANVNATTIRGTPLLLAAETGHAGMVKLLLENGADVTATDRFRNTALHVASNNEIRRLLIDKHASVTAANRDGVTPLHVAAALLDADAVQLLREHGADTNAKTSRGNLPVDWADNVTQEAVRRDSLGILWWFIQHGEKRLLSAPAMSDAGDRKLCPHCKGTGHQTEHIQELASAAAAANTGVAGIAKEIDNKCRVCGGVGYVHSDGRRLSPEESNADNAMRRATAGVDSYNLGFNPNAHISDEDRRAIRAKTEREAAEFNAQQRSMIVSLTSGIVTPTPSANAPGDPSQGKAGVTGSTTVPTIPASAASDKTPGDIADRWIGDWQGGDVRVRIVRIAADLVMDEPKTGFHSTEVRVVGDSAMFRWSNANQIMVLKVVSPGRATIACYPSTAGAAFDRGQIPEIKPHWQAEMQLLITGVSNNPATGAAPRNDRDRSLVTPPSQFAGLLGSWRLDPQWEVTVTWDGKDYQLDERWQGKQNQSKEWKAIENALLFRWDKDVFVLQPRDANSVSVWQYHNVAHDVFDAGHPLPTNANTRATGQKVN